MDPIEIALAADQAAQQLDGNSGKMQIINWDEYLFLFQQCMNNALITKKKLIYKGLTMYRFDEFLNLFTQESPIAIVKANVSTGGASGYVYALAKAMALGNDIVQVSITGSFYFDAIYEFEAYVSYDNSLVFSMTVNTDIETAE